MGTIFVGWVNHGESADSQLGWRFSDSKWLWYDMLEEIKIGMNLERCQCLDRGQQCCKDWLYWSNGWNSMNTVEASAHKFWDEWGFDINNIEIIFIIPWYDFAKTNHQFKQEKNENLSNTTLMLLNVWWLCKWYYHNWWCCHFSNGDK